MEKRNGFRRQSIGRYRSEEYQEEDVWGVIRSEERESASTTSSSPLPILRKLPSAARMIIPSGTHNHELQPHHHHHHHHHHDGMVQHSSAPVNIPDWSKIYGKSTPTRKNEHDVHHDGHHDCDDGHHDDNDDDDDDDGGRMTLAPHEWLARKEGRSEISSFSVCEGAGRKLKGRDLSRVRNAVLSKTGFI